MLCGLPQLGSECGTWPEWPAVDVMIGLAFPGIFHFRIFNLKIMSKDLQQGSTFCVLPN